MLGKCLQKFQHCRILLGSEEVRIKISILQLRQINCHTRVNKLCRDLTKLCGVRFAECDLSGLKKTEDLFAGLERDCTIAKPSKASNFPSPCSGYIAHLRFRLQTSSTPANELSEHRPER